MSDAVNPYQSPESAAVPVKPLVAQGTLTETMLIYLKGASPWLRFVGVMGFIGAGLTAVSGLVFLAIVPLMRQLWDEVPGLEGLSGYIGAAFGGSMAILFIGLGVLMFFPSLFIYRFGEKVRSYLRTGTDQDLELAFKNNKSLWKFIGILTIIELAFIPLSIIGGIIAAIAIAIAR